MDISKIDLNLLVVFDAVLRKRSVSLAGESIGLSQPAMSYALTKLRKLFNDPLFVRTSRGMQPTPRSLELSGHIREAIDHINLVFRQSSFDPASATRTFRFCMSDVGEIVFLPGLLARMREVAPGCNVKSVQVPTKRVQQMLEHGDVDLAVGYFPDLQAGFYQQTLFAHSVVCIVRADHPTIRDELTLHDYLECGHGLVNAAGRSQEVVEKSLAEHGIKRRVQLEIPHYMVIPLILRDTDMIVTVPKAVGILFSKLVNIKMFPAPFHVPDFELKQHWHERYNNDPVNRWLRGQVADLFLGKTHWW